MKDMSSSYRTEGQDVLIEMNVRSLASFFSTFDPSPFVEKDIDPEAEEYIVDAALEISARRSLKLVVYLPPDEATRESSADLGEAIHNFFSYRQAAAIRDLRQIFQRGQWALFIGLCFLSACLVVRALLHLTTPVPEVWQEIIQEGLLIVGWVAMWRPLDIFLYDWWSAYKMITVYRRLALIPTEIRSRS